jgi:cyclophilin family peptidyl-prolyl cis-trans isomerase
MKTSRSLALAALFATAALPLAAAAQAPAAAPAPATCDKVKLTTSMGPIVLQLDRAKAPISVENFTKYVKAGHYDGTIFHRVMNGFMIQGGGFTKDMQEKPTQAPIKNESTNKLSNDPYTVAMARRPDPNSATAQFFINVADNSRLNYENDMRPGYAVFGKVVSGQETVDKIRKVPTGTSGPYENVPTTPVVIQKAECQ